MIPINEIMVRMHYSGMGTDFEKKKNNLCGDTADFTPPPPYLVQDFMQSPVIDMCTSKVLHRLPKNSASNSHNKKTRIFLT